MSYQVDTLPSARRDFDGLPPAIQERVAEVLRALAANPLPHGHKPLREQALKGSYRVHVGRGYCVGYDIDETARIVEVWQIARRDRFYEKAKRRRR